MTNKKRQQHKKFIQNKHTRKTIENGIQFDPNGGKDKKGLYYVQLFMGFDENGKSVRKTKSFLTLSEARKCKREFEAQKTLGKYPKPQGRVKLLDYIDEFITTAQRSESSIYNYTRIRNYIAKSDLRKYKMEEIKPKHIRAYIAYLQANTKLKPISINKHLMFLSVVFDRAYKDDVLQENPAKKVDKLKVEKYVGKSYTLEECKLIFDKLKDYGNRNVQLLFHFGVLHGLRRGELCGLKWVNVDLSKGEIYIRDNKTKVGGKVIVKAPKTEKSNRDLEIDSVTKELLERIKDEQQEKFGGCEYVMVSPQTGKGISPASLQKPFKLFLAKYGFRDLRIHDLRHTFSTQAINSGVNILEISRALGHSNTNTTESIYIHLLRGNNSAAIRGVGRAIFGEGQHD